MVPMLIIGIVWQVSVPGWTEWLHIFVVLGAYFMWYRCRRGGQTLAMQTWRLAGGRHVRGRDLAASGNVSLCAGMAFGAQRRGLLWALVDTDRQFLHDRLAGSRIVLMPPAKWLTIHLPGLICCTAADIVRPQSEYCFVSFGVRMSAAPSCARGGFRLPRRGGFCRELDDSSASSPRVAARASLPALPAFP